MERVLLWFFAACCLVASAGAFDLEKAAASETSESSYKCSSTSTLTCASADKCCGYKQPSGNWYYMCCANDRFCCAGQNGISCCKNGEKCNTALGDCNTLCPDGKMQCLTGSTCCGYGDATGQHYSCCGGNLPVCCYSAIKGTINCCRPEQHCDFSTGYCV